MRLIYSLTYFKRIWIQQEVFAARELRLQSGHSDFEWKGLLSQPDLLYTLPQIREDQTPLISELVDIHADQLSCFDYFRQKQEERPYLIDTLLYTGRLESTNTRDYVYGILGLTSYPSQKRTLHFLPGPSIGATLHDASVDGERKRKQFTAIGFFYKSTVFPKTYATEPI